MYKDFILVLLYVLRTFSHTRLFNLFTLSDKLRCFDFVLKRFIPIKRF